MSEKYKNFVNNRTHSTVSNNPDLVFHVFGMVCEAGEAGDVIKKLTRGDKNIDLNDFVLECGDVLYYMTRALELVGSSVEDAMEKNIKKLEHRAAHGK